MESVDGRLPPPPVATVAVFPEKRMDHTRYGESTLFLGFCSETLTIDDARGVVLREASGSHHGGCSLLSSTSL